MKYRHLLVPVDLADPESVTIETALELAAQHHAETTLLYVIESIDRNGNDDEENGWDEFFAGLEATVRERMESIVSRFREAGLSAHSEIVVGHGPREIVQFSATRAVDLVVMSSQRVDLNRPFENLTSASHQVSLFCQCPVMLVK